jgi:excisionase family DNA binding protein
MADTTKAPEGTTAQLEPLQVEVIEAARLLGYSRATIYAMLNSGELPSTRQGTAASRLLHCVPGSTRTAKTDSSATATPA